LEQLRRRAGLRKHELELVACLDAKLSAGLGTHANPIEPGGRLNSAVRFHRNGEAPRVQSFYQIIIHLQQRLAARKHDKSALLCRTPFGLDRVGELCRPLVAIPARSIGADKIRVAELTLRGGAILLAPRPEIAASKAAEYGRAAGMRALALQG